MLKAILAIDIGASSGRHIVSFSEDNKTQIKEIYRFSNGMERKNNRIVWNMETLYSHVKKGIEIANDLYEVLSIGIDTWGVDYVLLDENDSIIGEVVAYRDDSVRKSIEKVHEILPFETLYDITGVQFQPFNTIYQLYRDKIEGKLDKASSFMMIPDYLNFLLTGVKRNEYTNASTSGMLDLSTGSWSEEIIKKLNLPPHLFKELFQPEAVVGACNLCGRANIIHIASHDTASAFEAVNGNKNIILSSGTWSLMGVKLDKAITTEKSRIANFTNEAGVGYIRYLKNIMGMWIINSIAKESEGKYTVLQLTELAEKSTCEDIVDVNDSRFIAPTSMLSQFPYEDIGDVARVVFRLLAACYAQTVKEIETITGNTYHAIEIVGGGVKNEFLCMMTEQMCKRKVIRGETEATAVGNIIVQNRRNNM